MNSNNGPSSVNRNISKVMYQEHEQINLQSQHISPRVEELQRTGADLARPLSATIVHVEPKTTEIDLSMQISSSQSQVCQTPLTDEVDLIDEQESGQSIQTLVGGHCNYIDHTLDSTLLPTSPVPLTSEAPTMLEVLERGNDQSHGQLDGDAPTISKKPVKSIMLPTKIKGVTKAQQPQPHSIHHQHSKSSSLSDYTVQLMYLEALSKKHLQP